ncbi:glucuronate isomerase [Sinomicrobium pectinilyticum]|uniref:Uronate isomerase n=1 Tax=Sinomicrobium pectinilyticum TaxID=1084421 RepID=A0A3N0F547_SINP1|nr:glucuronate isomerase [Sinomicrobium pectinilyticum]RNL95244.1 glucuronate isomerase [Sinomicrobium pectinilyticum]
MSFIKDESFLLSNDYARELYFNYAEKQPIIDYHCHLPPDQIAGDKVFENLTQIWIYGDHYKWRAMRTLGIDEKYITGNGTDEEKFRAWAETVPYTLRNPLYHWTHLELKRYFGIETLLSEKTADEIYRQANEKLNTTAYSCRGLLTKMNVEVVCTTEDPTDSLEHHQKLAGSDYPVKVTTSFRPDKAIMITNEGFNDYVEKLGEAAGMAIGNYNDLLEVLKKRIQYFHDNGSRVSDHGLEQIYSEDYTEAEVKAVFEKKRNGKTITREEALKFQSAVLYFLAETYCEFGWVQQFHLGALRNNNSRMNRLLGPDTGWDSIGDFTQSVALSRFLNKLDSKNKLAKTILYNLNPADNEVMASMIGNFNDGSVKGKVQFGSGWWFLDQKDGMTKQMNALSNMGLISCFVGMLTDSRSFLSFPRHEYFRRLVCNLFGEEIENGELPADMEWIGKIVSDICYNNAKDYFGF